MHRPYTLLSVLTVGLPFFVACGGKEEEDSDDGGGGGGGGIEIDLDGDGYTSDVDCNDNQALINPGAPEVCNSVDDNCNGEVDEDATTRFYGDDDQDGYGDSNDYADLCTQQPGQVTQGGDCRDDNAAVNPGVTEVCDGIDNNCDGAVDEDLIVDLYDDADGDGYGIDSTSARGCPDGRALLGGDCDDEDPTRYPDAPEYCGDGIVNACGGNATTAAADCTGDLTGNDISLGLGTAFTGQTLSQGAGFGVAHAGDVDGDGRDDILIGAPGDNGNTGAAYLVRGRAAAGRLSSQATATFPGEASGDLVGYRMSGAGDVDADGYDDILLGASGATVLKGAEGRAYLVRGPVTGSRPLSGADVRLLGEMVDASLGYSMGPAGDLNGDGIFDVLFGAYLDSEEATYGGTTYVLYGPVSDGSRAIRTAADAWISSGIDNVGSSLAIAGGGDMNGDGVDDLAISAPYAVGPDGAGAEGSIHVLYGPVTAGGAVLETRSDATLYGVGYQDFVGTSMSMGDFDGDGMGDLLTTAINAADYAGRASIVYGGTALPAEGTLADVAGATVTSLGVAFYVESFFAGNAGDLDNDGVDDLILGAPYVSYGAVTNGSAYVFHGPVTGFQTPAGAALRIRGSAAGAQAGISVSGAGDFDGDGRGEVLVGAPGAPSTGAGVVISFTGTGTY